MEQRVQGARNAEILRSRSPGGALAAQDDNAPGFEEPVRVYEVRWRETNT